VGAPTIRKTLSLLRAMLRQAVAWDRIRLNPVKQVSKPKAPRQRAVVALSPSRVETLRGLLIGGYVEHRPHETRRTRDIVHKPDLVSATLGRCSRTRAPGPRNSWRSKSATSAGRRC
jgi:hypothetical protein